MGKTVASANCVNSNLSDGTWFRNLVEAIPVLKTLWRKPCTRCKETKPLVEYSKTKKNEDGLQGWCRACNSKYKKEYRASNPQKLKETNSSYYNDNKERISEQRREYNRRTKKERNERDKVHRSKDPVFKLICYSRSRIWGVLRGQIKEEHSVEIVGMSGAKYMAYLETTFWPGMSRENQGRKGWAVDHIVPIESFDKTDPEWYKKAFHWSNTRALWYDDNTYKGARLDWTPDESKHPLPEWWMDRGMF